MRVDTHGLAYAAGIIDGEGTIGCHASTSGTSTTYSPHVCVQMSKPHVIFWLLKVFGGVRSLTNDRYGEMYSWRLNGTKAGEFLKSIQPYLILKMEQAALAIEMASTLCTSGSIVPEDTMQRRLEIHKLLASLNARRSAPEFDRREVN